MSEYQVYEFAAIDQPLSSQQMAELRGISTRADIGPTHFKNEYQWGNLKADPENLVQEYFDVGLHVANYGIRRLLFRLPKAQIDLLAVEPYFQYDGLSLTTAGKYVVIDICPEGEPDTWDQENEVSMGDLVALRAELLSGDLRPAYLAWLVAVQSQAVDEEEDEPNVPPGLNDLSGAQQAMITFYAISTDLVAAAAEQSTANKDDTEELRKWVAAMSTAKKTEMLLRAVDNPKINLGGELKRMFHEQKPKATEGSGRTVSDLLTAAKTLREKREKVEATAAEKKRQAEKVKRDKHLDALAASLEEKWTELEALIQEVESYKVALPLCLDLKALSERSGGTIDFKERFAAMKKRNPRRTSFFNRWKNAVHSVQK